MRIRTRLFTSAALATLVSLLLAVGLLYVTRQAGAGLDEQAESQQVARDVANMLSLTNEFSIFGGERATAQWRARHAQLVATVKSATKRYADPSPELADLRRNIDDLPSLFDKLAEIGHDPKTPVAQRRRDLLLERLLTETQEVVESRYRWAIAVGRMQRSNQRLYSAMVLGAPGVLLLLLISLGMVVGRRVLKPLAHIEATVNNIRDGDLGARCDTGARDELGDAARAVDSMTSTLQQQGETLFVANASLLREVTGRRTSEERLHLVTDNLPALVSYLDRDQRFRFANRAYRDWLDVEPDALIGRSLSELYGEAAYAAMKPHMESALAGTSATYERDLATPRGIRHVQVALVPQRDDQGCVQGLVTTIHDITERKLVEVERAARQLELEASLREKEVLLKEIHHRVKNNLQVVSSLLQLQAGYVENEAARNVFEESQRRIRSMALVHEKLYQTKDLAHIDFGDYVRELVSGLIGSFAARGARVTIDVQATSLQLDVDRAVPAGLIINELVNNCFKHAFPDNRTGRIDVSLSGGGNMPIQLVVRDDGVGWPTDFLPEKSATLGLRLVHILAKQLRASLHLRNDQGIACSLILESKHQLSEGRQS